MLPRASLLALFVFTSTMAGNAQPQQLSETYGSWVLRCQSQQSPQGATGPQVCKISQERRQAESNQLVMALSYQVLKDGGAAVLVVAPFGLRLSEGVAYMVGEETLWTEGFQTCVPTGCLSVPKLTSEQVTKVLAAETAQVAFVTNTEQPLRVEVETDGLKQAWERLKELDPGQ